ncbi:MAG: TetR/AcrR family transcriptional regulator [Bacteroidota bacterium]|nr:TetR/AcrR family transcriptional regulator [Bacteroidota bacterium]
MKDTKEIILKTAYDMFLYNNYEAVTINSIIKTAGLTKGAIYHYFASKEELFKAVVDKYMIENKIDIAIEHASLLNLIDYSINKVKEGIAIKLVSSGDNKSLPILHVSLILAAFRYYPGYAEIGNKFFNNEVDKWKKVIERAIEKGEVRKDINAEVVSMNFIAIGTSIVPIILLGCSVEYSIEMYEKQMKELYKNIRV